jgi:hypothetical protein
LVDPYREDDIMDTVETVVKRLLKTPGVVACWVVPDADRDSLRQLENEANLRLGLPGMDIVNEGIRDALARQHVVIISHSPALRHPPGPIIVILDGERIVGEEIWQPGEYERLSKDPNALFLGKSLVLYRDALGQARGKPLKLAYRALPFSEVDEVPGVKDVVSITITIPVHSRLSQKAGWNPNDPNLGTVLIGFNVSNETNTAS